MSSLGQPMGSPAGVTIRAGKGDTLKNMAARFYKDERLAELLLLANPGMTRDGSLPEGAVVRLPDRETTQKWAVKRGITVGLDPNRASGTKQKRAWNKFQTGPGIKAVSSPSLALGPEAALLGLLGVQGKDTLGPGIITATVAGQASALRDAVADRMHWLGVPRVLEAGTHTTTAQLEKRALEAATAAKVPAAAPALCQAVHQALSVVIAQEVLKDARSLFARAQQALGVTARDPQGGQHLLASLKDAEPEARVRLLTALAVPKDVAARAAQVVEQLPAVRQGLLAATGLAGKAREDALRGTGLPVPVLREMNPRLVPNLGAVAVEALSFQALGLDGAARQAQQGAEAMHTLVQRAVTTMKAQVDGATALASFPAARAAAYRDLRIALDPWEFPPPATDGMNVLEHSLVSGADALSSLARKLPDTLRVAWKAVEALGPQLGEVDATALGQGVGALLARVAAPTVRADDDVRRMRAGDLMSMGGQAAVRSQVGVEATRSLAPLAAPLALVERFPFAAGQVPPTQRMELRRRLVDTFRVAYAHPAGAALPLAQADATRRTLLSLLSHASGATGALPDAVERAAKARALVDKGPLVDALVKGLGGQHYKFRREEMSLDGRWLLCAAWLVEHARETLAPDATVQALHHMLQEEGGRVLDAVERELLKKL